MNMPDAAGPRPNGLTPTSPTPTDVASSESEEGWRKRGRHNSSAIVVVVGFGIALLAITVPHFYAVLPQTVVAFIVLVATWRRLGPVWESPALVFSCFMLLNGTLGFAFSNFLSDFGGTAGADTSLSDSERLATANVFFLAAIVVPILAASVAGKAKGPTTWSASRDPVSVRANALGLTVAFAILIALATLNGVEWLMHREERFADDSGGTLSLLSLLAIACTVILGSAVAGRSAPIRVAAWVLIAGYALLYLSLASRSLALLPLLVLAGAGLLGARPPGKLAIVSAIVLSAAMLPIPLLLRSESAHGLLPYLDALAIATFSGDDYLTSANNVLNGFGIVGTSAFRVQPITPEQLAVSLSPLTGGAAGWYEIAAALRLNFYTPYAALGELANLGWLAFAAAMAALGLSFGLVQRVARAATKNPRVAILRFLPIGLCLLFTVQVTQYNLRSEARLVYYALGVSVLLAIVTRVTSGRVDSVSSRAGRSLRPGMDRWVG